VAGRSHCPNTPAINPLFHEWEAVGGEVDGRANVWLFSKARCSIVPYVMIGRIALRLLECGRPVLLIYLGPHVSLPSLFVFQAHLLPAIVFLSVLIHIPP
jgi:hypothetical protein